jgi:hypothetical protein
MCVHSGRDHEEVVCFAVGNTQRPKKHIAANETASKRNEFGSGATAIP